MSLADLAPTSPALSTTSRESRRAGRWTTVVLAVLVGFMATGSVAAASIAPDSGPVAGGTEVTVPVPGADSMIHVAGGDLHSLALDADGNLWTWGSDTFGQVGNGATTGNITAPTQVTTGTTYTTIAAGSLHSLALDTDGNLWTWGNDGSGQVGNGATTGDVDTPTQVTTGVEYTAIAVGDSHSLALDTDGNLWTWGNDGSGQVGNGATTGDITTPTQVTTGTTYTTIAAGYYHSLALDTDGNLWTWGRDNFGQVGNGATTGDVDTPTQVTTGTTYTTISSGYYYSLALDADGNLWTWGQNASGQLGNGTPTGNVDEPAQITTGTTYTTIATGGLHSLALDTDGNLWTWGNDDAGQLGNGSTTGNITTPTQVTTGTTYTTVAAGFHHSLALDTDGNLWTWGNDTSGQLGNGATTGNITTPTLITTGTSFTTIAAGNYHSLALDTDGNLWTWGHDGSGQVGNGATTGNITTPTLITTGTSFTTIAAGAFHSLALDTDGNLWTWGNDDDGQVGNGATTGDVTTPTQVTTDTTYTSIAAGNLHSLALDTDGNLWTWGNDNFEQLGNGATTGTITTPTQVTTGTTYTTIAAGYYHSLALDTDGNLWTWGYDAYGQVGNGSTTGDVTTPTQITTGTTYTTIAAGRYHSLARDTDGNLWTWGNDASGQLGNGATTGNITTPTQVTTGTTIATIAAGYHHSLALDTDGNLWTWGNDDDGQVGNGATTGNVTAPARPQGATDITGIDFDGIPGTDVERISATLAQVTTPAGMAGAATVTVSYNYNDVAKPPLTLTQSFTYLAAVPDAPTGLTPTSGDSQVALSWTAPASDGGDPITDYRIEYSDDGGGTWTTFADGTSTATTTTVTGLTNGTEYTFRVSAANTVGTGTPSATATATPVAVPDAPTGLNLTLSATTVTAGDSLSVSADGFAPNEDVEVWINSTPALLLSGTATNSGTLSHTVTIPTNIPAGAHQIEVRGTNSGSVFTDITVTAVGADGGLDSDGLADSGISPHGTLGIAAALMMIGGATVVARRRFSRARNVN